jgi:phycocyanobilin lyase beta subunit
MIDTRTLIEAVNKADSADSLLEAVENLAAASTETAIPTLVEVLSYNNPGAAVAAVDGLIAIGEPAVPYLLNNVDDYNYGARAWTIRAFAGIGDPRAFDLLLKAATTDFSQSVRRAAARGLGFIHWSKLPSEKRLSAQKEAMETLFLTAKDGEWVVRYATIVGLEGLSNSLIEIKHNFIEEIVGRLEEIKENDLEIVVRARASLAWQRIKGNTY